MHHPRRRMVAALAVMMTASGAYADDTKNARCATTDDGMYPCSFRLVDDNGSFEISAEGKSTYTLNISEPGTAYGFVVIDGRSVALPGRYERSTRDRACWRNDATATEICAW
jgi:hypothetical protein